MQINQKYHYDKSKVLVSQEDILEFEKKGQTVLSKVASEVEKANKKISEHDDSDLMPVKGRVIVKLDMEGKNTHTFNSGLKIRLERQYNNLNRRETEPVNAIVVNGEGLENGDEILIHHNSCHPVNQIFNYLALSSDEKESTIKYFSILEEECFLYRKKDSSTWNVCKGWATALRIYNPYKGTLTGIEPTQVKNILWITSGAFKNMACHVVKHCEYEIIYQGIDGKEERVIRIRNFTDKITGLKFKSFISVKQENEREEIIGIDNEITDKVKNGKLLIGVEPNKAVKYE